MNYRKYFSANLLSLRKQHKLSLQALGDILGISNQAVSLLEKGHNAPSFDVLCALSNHFNVSIDTLISRPDNYLNYQELFPQRLKILRQSSDVTLEQVAEAIDVSVNFVAKIEYGHAAPSVKVLLALADYFNVSLDYLVGRSDNPTIH